MNHKNAKLLRYYEKLTGDLKLPAQVRKYWSMLKADDKAKLTKYMRESCAKMLAIKNAHKAVRAQQNTEILKGFTK